MAEKSPQFKPNINEDSGIYNQQLYAAALKPKSKIEEVLWGEIERAEKPIRNILKRINRLSLEKFPEIIFVTEQSCSGHVTKTGELEREKSEAFKFIEIDEENPREDKWKDLNPFIMFSDTDKKDNKVVFEFFKKFFVDCIKDINKKFNATVMNLYPKKWILGFEFSVQKKEMAHQILKEFWNLMENKLAEFDHIKFKTDLEKADFSRDSWSRDNQ